MIVFLRKSLSLLLLMSLLVPSLAKVVHEHDDFVCNAKIERHLHNHHDSCAVCKFDFSHFSGVNTAYIPEASAILKKVYVSFLKGIETQASPFSFHLRAPPVFIIN